ncbi:hypothetical protein G6F45_014330 [Rhizopus arrhizus]|nr:hypothetical protein G6F45_014330 [Rhizopus arrhizus]
MCRFPTACANAAGSAKRRAAASTCIPTARAWARPIRKCWPSAMKNAAARASRRAPSRTKTSSAATWPP